MTVHLRTHAYAGAAAALTLTHTSRRSDGLVNPEGTLKIFIAFLFNQKLVPKFCGDSSLLFVRFI